MGAVVEARLLSGLVEGIALEAGSSGRVLEALVIRPGLSNNGRIYGEDVLRTSAGLWEGAPAFCDHCPPVEVGRPGGRSIRDLVGVYQSARYVEGRGVVARLRLYPAGEWLVALVEAQLADRGAGLAVAPVGISADMTVEQVEERLNGRVVRRVMRVVKVSSGDVVMSPSAGGEVLSVLEADGERGVPVATAGAVSEAGATTEGAVSEAVASVDEVRRELGVARAELTLARSGLSEGAQGFLRDMLRERRVTGGADVVAVVEAFRKVALPAASVVRGMGGPRGAARILTGKDRLQVSLDRLFGIEPPDYLSGIPRLTGIREAYIAITGDRFFDGRYHFEESVLEADEITTTILADALLDSMSKRLLKDYAGQRRWWEPIVVKVPITRMEAQSRVLLSDFASLATVAENGPYVNAAWGDTAETYTPIKKGNLYYVTMEAIINDDLRAVTRIPTKVARVATTTINELVSALFTTASGLGPNMADGVAVFNAAHGANTGVTALADASLRTALVTMAKQVNSASKRLGLAGKYLLVPADLMYTAQVLAGTSQVVGSAFNDINPYYGQLTPIVVPQWTDVNNWYLVADPSEIECLEVGFLNGREEPEILVQDNPTTGTVFTNDAITYKVRHIYGAGWLDYRGAFGAVVA